MAGIDAPLPGGMPRPVGAALGRLARPVTAAAVPPLVNRALAGALAGDRLAFLAGRVLGIEVPDLGLSWRLTLAAGGTRVTPASRAPDAVIRGDSLALLMLAARRVDPDTLFFERRIAVEGDTALGLEAKNLLDTLEPDDLPAPLARVLDRAGRLAEALSR